MTGNPFFGIVLFKITARLLHLFLQKLLVVPAHNNNRHAHFCPFEEYRDILSADMDASGLDF